MLKSFSQNFVLTRTATTTVFDIVNVDLSALALMFDSNQHWLQFAYVDFG